uniref:Uncharacterized protein n=1 Tax=Ixodes ricinus TaxID=34613 RepID=A0A6B0UBX0_IXORI
MSFVSRKPLMFRNLHICLHAVLCMLPPFVRYYLPWGIFWMPLTVLRTQRKTRNDRQSVKVVGLSMNVRQNHHFLNIFRDAFRFTFSFFFFSFDTRLSAISTRLPSR